MKNYWIKEKKIRQSIFPRITFPNCNFNFSNLEQLSKKKVYEKLLDKRKN